MLEMMTVSNGKKLPVAGNIEKFVTGGMGMAILTKTGNLYGIGDSYFSGTGAQSSQWTLLSGGVKTMWSGYRNLLVLTEDGRWLYQGVNTYFPTSLGGPFTTLVDVSAYMVFPLGETMKEISLGMYNMAVVFESGKYAMAGQNPSGGLGNGVAGDVRTLTVRTDFTNVKKIQIEPRSDDTSYLLVDTGQVYGAGYSGNGQLGEVIGSIPTWKALVTAARAPTIYDIKAGASSLFYLAEEETSYLVYARGWQFEGSLGTGQTVPTNVTSMLRVISIADKTGGPPDFYTGLYSARVKRKDDGTARYAGTSSGGIQGCGATFAAAGNRYSFVAIPEDVLWGEYHGLWGAYTASYILTDDSVYVTGNNNTANSWAFPGVVPGVYFEYTLMDTSFLL